MSDAPAAVLKSVIFGFVLFLIGLVGSGQALAACTQSDLAGRYQVYVSRSGLDGGGWTYCTAKVDSSGAIASDTKCISRDESGAESKEAVKGGSLTAAGSCRVSGKIKATGCGNVFTNNWLTFSNAFLSKSKDTIAGVGQDCEGKALLFTAVRR